MKKCFKCGVEKEISEFYKHPMMADGHLGKCKECTKRDVSERERRLRSSDPDWVMAERDRCREKSTKARIDGLPWTKMSYYHLRKRWVIKNRHKISAQTKARKAVLCGKISKADRCSECGSTGKIHMHHEDYSKPLDVAFLCPACHMRRHRKPRPS
jgi:hypothetical protein